MVHNPFFDAATLLWREFGPFITTIFIILLIVVDSDISICILALFVIMVDY